MRNVHGLRKTVSDSLRQLPTRRSNFSLVHDAQSGCTVCCGKGFGSDLRDL